MRSKPLHFIMPYIQVLFGFQLIVSQLRDNSGGSCIIISLLEFEISCLLWLLLQVIVNLLRKLRNEGLSSHSMLRFLT
jgi:hypothetical protein